MSYFWTFIGGAFATFIMFASFKFTPQVSVSSVERAVSVCKEGKWESINNSEIICADGAVYPRKGETK